MRLQSNMRFRPVRLAAILTVGIGLLPQTGLADDRQQLTHLINEFRQAGAQCEGQEREPVGPLAPSEALSQAKITRNTDLNAALGATGYQAAEAQAISLSGTADPQTAMRAIRQHYCSVVLDPRFAELGVSRRDNGWTLVLARPLLNNELGDWETAGKAVLEKVNAARKEPQQCGGERFGPAGALTWSQPLAEASLAHSRDMASQDYFSHRAPDGSHAGERAKRAGYRWSRVGENIAAGQSSAEQVVDGWLASPGHCKNLMNPEFTEMGAAYATEPRSKATIYWTQVFGTPR